MLGPLELILIVLAILLLFGGSKLPQIASGIGKAIKNFKYSLRGDDGIEVRRVEKDNKSDDEPSSES